MLSEYIPNLANVSFHIVAYMYARFRYSGKNPMRFAVFWRISVRFCGFRTPLTPPSVPVQLHRLHMSFMSTIHPFNFALLIHFREELKNDKRLLQIRFPPPLRFDFSRRLWRLFHKTQSCNDKGNSFNTNKIDVPYQICFWSKSKIICCEVLPSIKWQ